MEQKRRKASSSLRKYKTPSLTLYGPLHKLAKGGSGSKNEGGEASPAKRP